MISSLYTTGKLKFAFVSVVLQVGCVTKVLNDHIYLKASVSCICAAVVFQGQLLLVYIRLVYESQMQNIICVQK